MRRSVGGHTEIKNERNLYNLVNITRNYNNKNNTKNITRKHNTKNVTQNTTQIYSTKIQNKYIILKI